MKGMDKGCGESHEAVPESIPLHLTWDFFPLPQDNPQQLLWINFNLHQWYCWWNLCWSELADKVQEGGWDSTCAAATVTSIFSGMIHPSIHAITTCSAHSIWSTLPTLPSAQAYLCWWVSMITDVQEMLQPSYWCTVFCNAGKHFTKFLWQPEPSFGKGWTIRLQVSLFFSRDILKKDLGSCQLWGGCDNHHISTEKQILFVKYLSIFWETLKTFLSLFFLQINYSSLPINMTLIDYTLELDWCCGT